MFAIIISLSTIAQAQTPTLFLPVQASQSQTRNCMNFTTTNSGNTSVRNVIANHRGAKGNLNQMYVTSALKSGQTASF